MSTRPARLRRYGIAALLLLAPAAASAARAPARCSQVSTDAAETALGKVDSWAALHRFYARFGRCEDDGSSEDVVEKVVHTLAHHWSWLPNLAAETRADPAFEQYVLAHIDSTAGTDDLIEVRRTATLLCPPTLTGLCRRIRAAAATALRG